MSLYRKEAVAARQRRLAGRVVFAQPLAARVVSLAVVVLLIIAAAGASMIELPRRERVTGHVNALPGVIRLSAVNGGAIRQWFRSVNERVAAGDPIVEIEAQLSAGDSESREGLYESAVQRLDYVERQLGLLVDRYAMQRALQQVEIGSLEQAIQAKRSEVALKQSALDLAETRLARIRVLAADRLAAAVAVDEQQARVLSIRSEQAALEAQGRMLKANLRQASQRLVALSNEEESERLALRERQASSEQAVIEYRLQSAYLLHSPTAGRITALKGTPGQSPPRGESIVAILPDGAELEARLLAPSRAIGFVRPGSRVRLRVDAFPYQRYGELTGEVARISEVSIEAVGSSGDAMYELAVRLDRDYLERNGERFPLRVDMQLTADLIIDNRRLIDWLLDPLRTLRG